MTTQSKPAIVYIAGQRYAVRPDRDGNHLHQFYRTRLSEAQRLVGVQRRVDDTSVNRYPASSFPWGLGWSRIKREIGRGVGGLLDSTCWTALGPVTLGKLQEVQSHAAPADHLRKVVNFKSDLWGAFEQDFDANALECTCVTKFGASTDTWVAVDAPLFNASTEGGQTQATSITVSHTVQSTYANRIVIAFVYQFNGGDIQAANSVTYAGVAMTQLGGVTSGDLDSRVSLWYLVAPTTGANNCVASCPVGGTPYFKMHVADYYFVNQTTPFGTAQTGTGTATSTTVTAVTTTAGDLVIGGVQHVANEATAPGTGLFERNDTAAASSGSAEYSEGRATGASTTWAASWVTNSVYVAVAAPLLAAGFVAAPESEVAFGQRIFDMVAHKASLFILGNGPPTGEVIYKVLSSTDGDAWVDASGTGFPDNTGTNRYLTTTITRRNNFDDDMGRLLSFGNVLLAAIRRHPSSTDGATSTDIQVWSSTDSGSNWALEVSIPSADGPKALVDWLTIGGVRSPVLVIPDGIYSIDTSADTFSLIYALDGDPNTGRWAEVGNDGSLYVGLGSGSILRLTIREADNLDVMVIGPPGDGLVTARQGRANYILKTPSEWLLVAHGGHAASRNASIFMIDTSVILTDPETGKRFMPWHHLYQDATANLDIVALAYSTEDDGTARLHLAVEGAAASVNSHIEEPFVNPKQSTTVKYQATSILRLPVDDLGDPNLNAMILQAYVAADDLTAGSGGSGGATDEFITLRYGLNGASDTTVSRGDFLSGQLSLTFRASGSITAFADAGAGMVTVTSSAHGLVEGDSVTISGTTSYNGTFTISNVATNTFDIRDTWVADDATGTWGCLKGIAARTIGINLLFDRGSTNTNRPLMDEFELQAQNVYVDKLAWQMTIDIEETKKLVPPNIVEDTPIQETIIANLEALAELTTLSPFQPAENASVIYVRSPNDQPPVWNLRIVESDERNKGFRTGTCVLTVEVGI